MKPSQIRKLDTLKRRVERGDYHVPAETLAEAILERAATGKCTRHGTEFGPQGCHLCYEEYRRIMDAEWYAKQARNLETFAAGKARPTAGEVFGIEADAHYLDAEEAADEPRFTLAFWVCLVAVGGLSLIALGAALWAYRLATGGH